MNGDGIILALRKNKSIKNNYEGFHNNKDI
jgi:hypothetical protein